MSATLIGIVGCVYFYCFCEQITTPQFWMGVALFGWAVGNLGLVGAMAKWPTPW